MKRQLIPFLYCTFLLFLGACQATIKSGFEQHIHQIGVTYSNHNIEYQFDPNFNFMNLSQSSLDRFDKVFLEKLQNGLTEKGYQINSVGSMQNLEIHDCIIDIRQNIPTATWVQNDTLWLSNIDASLICKKKPDSTNLFFARYQYQNQFESVPLNQFSGIHNDKVRWIFTEKTAYREFPLTENESIKIAQELAKNVVDKLDTSQKIAFSQNYPELANKVYKTTGVEKFFIGIGKTIAVTLILFVILI